MRPDQGAGLRTAAALALGFLLHPAATRAQSAGGSAHVVDASAAPAPPAAPASPPAPIGGAWSPHPARPLTLVGAPGRGVTLSTGDDFFSLTLRGRVQVRD